jgi:hypothetical protein
MNFLIASMLGFLLLLNQETTASDSRILLEVDKLNGGMVAEPGQYLLRVFSNGNVAIEISSSESSKVVHKGKLSSARLEQLRDLLNKKDTKSLAKEYLGSPAIDHFDRTLIKIYSDKTLQQISVFNFCPKCKKVTYPDSLINILFEIEAIREILNPQQKNTP